MDHAGNLATEVCATVSSGRAAKATTATDALRPGDGPRPAALRRLWERMTTLYGAAWSAVNGVSPERSDGSLTLAGDTWMRVLSGVSEAQIATGLAACMSRAGEYAPKPGEFRALCLGVPSFAEVAEQLIARRAELSSFGRRVWQFIRDPYEFRTAAAQRQEALLREAYAQARAWVMAGKPLPVPPAAPIEHKPEPKRYLPDTVVQTMLGDLLKRL